MSKTSTLHEYARIGAGARLIELKAEIAEIHQTFPDLAGAVPAGRRPGRQPRRPKAQPAAPAARATEPTPPKLKRRRMSAAGRKAISEAQKARWAKLKAGKK